MSDSGTRGTIGLIHGTGHGAWSWELLQPELEARGFETIAMDLPVDKPGVTYEDYADAAALALSQATEDGKKIDLLVAHSGGAQAVPGVVKRLGSEAIGGIAYISGSLGEADADMPMLPARGVWSSPIPRQRSSSEFQDANLPLADGRMAFDAAHIEELFFNDCPPDRILWAIKHILPYTRPKDEPPLSAHRHPGIPKWYILGKEDRIRDREWAFHAAGSLGMTLVEISGGHSPAISRPKELADLLAYMADCPLKHLLGLDQTELPRRLNGLPGPPNPRQQPVL